jgi:hypothetical protein
LVEAPLEQDQPALEVVLELGQFERRVEPHLAVGEVDPAIVVVVPVQRPQDAAGHVFDQIVTVDQ